MNNGMKARTRVRSIAATLELVSMTTKYVTEAATITPVVTWDRFDSLTNPVVNDTTITTTATTITPITQPIALRGKGFGTVRPWPHGAKSFAAKRDWLGYRHDCRRRGGDRGVVHHRIGQAVEPVPGHDGRDR